MIGSSQNLKVRDILCALRFVREVNVSISHGGRDECGMSTATVTRSDSASTGPGLPLSVTLTGVGGSVDLTSASIKRNLNIL